jgi:hypothetical protein
MTKVQIQGKGYGEGQIIEYALTHSEHLKKSSSFFKCTGKLWVENFWEIIPPLSNKFISRAVFKNIIGVFPTRILNIDTRFFYASKDFYMQELSKLYLETSFEKNKSIEKVFLKKINQNKIEHFIFGTTPLIYGMSGGSASYYKNNNSKIIKNYVRFLILKNSPNFKSFICTVL